MDKIQQKLGQKQEEKRAAEARLSGGFGDDDDMDGNGFGSSPDNVVIDEEELNLLRLMKDMKKTYRENYDKLKKAKVEI